MRIVPGPTVDSGLPYRMARAGSVRFAEKRDSLRCCPSIEIHSLLEGTRRSGLTVRNAGFRFLPADGLPCMCRTGSCECVELRSCSFAVLGKTGMDAVLSCFRSVSRRLSLRRLSGAAVSGRSADLLSEIRSGMSRACRNTCFFGPSFRSALVGISRLGHDRRKVPLFVRPGKRGEIIFRPFRKFPNRRDRPKLGRSRLFGLIGAAFSGMPPVFVRSRYPGFRGEACPREPLRPPLRPFSFRAALARSGCRSPACLP